MHNKVGSTIAYKKKKPKNIYAHKSFTSFVIFCIQNGLVFLFFYINKIFMFVFLFKCLYTTRRHVNYIKHNTVAGLIMDNVLVHMDAKVVSTST